MNGENSISGGCSWVEVQGARKGTCTAGILSPSSCSAGGRDGTEINVETTSRELGEAAWTELCTSFGLITELSNAEMFRGFGGNDFSHWEQKLLQGPRQGPQVTAPFLEHVERCSNEVPSALPWGTKLGSPVSISSCPGQIFLCKPLWVLQEGRDPWVHGLGSHLGSSCRVCLPWFEFAAVCSEQFFILRFGDILPCQQSQRWSRKGHFSYCPCDWTAQHSGISDMREGLKNEEVSLLPTMFNKQQAADELTQIRFHSLSRSWSCAHRWREMRMRGHKSNGILAILGHREEGRAGHRLGHFHGQAALFPLEL